MKDTTTYNDIGNPTNCCVEDKKNGKKIDAQKFIAKHSLVHTVPYMKHHETMHIKRHVIFEAELGRSRCLHCAGGWILTAQGLSLPSSFQWRGRGFQLVKVESKAKAVGSRADSHPGVFLNDLQHSMI